MRLKGDYTSVSENNTRLETNYKKIGRLENQLSLESMKCSEITDCRKIERF